MARDDRTNELGLFNFAKTYRKAADILAVEHPNALRFDDPIRYLFYHSIELYLKAFLRKHALTVAQMKGLRHGFAELCDARTERGLWLTEEDREVLELIDAEGNYIRARYIETGAMTVATIHGLSRTAASLAETVGNHLRASGVPLREIRQSPLKNSESFTTSMSDDDRVFIELAGSLIEDSPPEDASQAELEHIKQDYLRRLDRDEASEARMADGWAVEVTMKTVGGGGSKQVYYAHLPDRSAAEQAVAQRVAATPDVKVQAKVPVPHNTFVEMHVAEGKVSQWM